MEEFRKEAALQFMVEFIKKPEVLRDAAIEMENRGELDHSISSIDFAADRAVVFADALIKRLEK